MVTTCHRVIPKEIGDINKPKNPAWWTRSGWFFTRPEKKKKEKRVALGKGWGRVETRLLAGLQNQKRGGGIPVGGYQGREKGLKGTVFTEATRTKNPQAARKKRLASHDRERRRPPRKRHGAWGKKKDEIQSKSKNGAH